MTDIPLAVANYFAGSNAHDPDAIARAFAEDARVHDEAKDHVGRADIRAWAAKTTSEYNHTTELLSAAPRDGGVAVDGRVTGTFPGSPVVLRYAFGLRGDEIVSLKVTPA